MKMESSTCRPRFIVAAMIAAVAGVVLLIPDESEAAGSRTRTRLANVKGIVTDSQNRPLVEATVYFIDSSTIDTTPIKPSAILDGSAEAYDEPLEDIVNNQAKAKELPQAKTDRNGKFSVRKLKAASTYYAFVVPKTGDYLPGGNASRIAFTPKALGKGGLHIKMSWNTPSDATYIGSSACYLCHGPDSKADMTSNKKHGHALMFHKPGQDTANQDSAHHPGSSWNELANKFTVATQTPGKAPVAVAANTPVETLYFQEYDAKQSNRFVIYENTPGTNVDPTTGKAGEVWVKAYLWQTGVTSNGNYYVTLENVINKTDPNNFRTLQVGVMMGGYIRQAILLKIPGLKSLYRFIGYQAISGSASRGLQGNYDRSRKPFTDAGLTGSFSSYFDATKKLLTLPAAVNPATGLPNNNVSCAMCHTGFGTHEPFIDPLTGERLAHTVDDSNGVFDLGGDGRPMEVGIGCEQCHGPGSKHREENLKVLTAPTQESTKKPKKPAEDTTGKYIVNPALLGADRASLICGRCHDASGVLAEDEEPPYPAPGISRAEFLSKWAAPAQKGIRLNQLWPDGESGRGGHHGFTYVHWLLSKHARNSRQMVACDDCHDAMGNSTHRYFLKGDPDDSTGGLCLQCHAVNVTEHVTAKTGSIMTGESMNCIQCHMTRTGKAGAGRPGVLLGTPSGITTNANIVYWENDQSAHNFKVPRKFTPGVAGAVPGSAMPTPYTNSCGTCHDASSLQYQAPNN